MIEIYQITNPKGQKYIGSSNNVKKRLVQHKYKPSLIGMSLNEFGIDNHSVDVLTKVSNEDRYELEHFIIQEMSPELNQVNDYNATATDKIWVNDGSKEFQVYPNYFDQSYMERGRLLNVSEIGKANKGRIQSNETIEKKIKAMNISVSCFKDGVHVLDFDSAKNAGLDLGIDPSSITKCCKGKQKTTKGYSFIYKQLNIN